MNTSFLVGPLFMALSFFSACILDFIFYITGNSFYDIGFLQVLIVNFIFMLILWTAHLVVVFSLKKLQGKY